MRRVDQNSRETGWRLVADAEGPRQTKWYPAAPRIAVESDGLALAGAVVAVGDEAVPRHRPAQQFDRGVLPWLRKRGETCGVWHPRDSPALRQIRSLLDPAPERQPAPLQPGVELRHGIGAILRVQQCVGERVRIGEILCPLRYAADRMIRGQRTDHSAEVPQLRLRGADPEHAAILLHYVNAGTPIGRIDHQVHRAVAGEHA